jgi:hypothetical protein
MSLKHPINQPQRWRFYQFFALKHLTNQIDAENIDWHLWASQDEAHLLREALPTGASVERHVCPPMEEEPASSLRTRIRKWLSASRIGETALVLTDAVRSFFRTARRLIRVAHRTQKALSSIDQSHPLHPKTREKPLVLVQTKFPKSWEQVPTSVDLEVSSAWYDHYFGDAPARLDSEEYVTGWLTSVEPETDRAAQWNDVRRTQSIPDATPWMVLSSSEAWQIAWHRLKWGVIYLYLFVWREVHSQWRYEGIPLGHWFKNAYRWGWTTDAFADIDRYRHACASLKPDAVLYRDEFYLTNGRRLSAGGKGYSKLVGVQHGMIPREHTVYQWHEDDIEIPNPGKCADHVHHAPVPDRFAAFGAHYVEQFDDWGGYPASRVVPVGGLRHDVLVDQFGLRKPTDGRELQKSALRDAYDLPEHRPVLVLCTATKQTAAMWFEMVVEALEKESLDAFVAVKLHQYHGGEGVLRCVAERCSFASYNVYTEDVYPLMAASDVLVGSASTTILEGNLFGLYSIAICANQEYEVYPFSRDGLAAVVANTLEMRTALKRGLSGGTRGSNLHRHLRNTEGSACRRLGSFLNQRGLRDE